MPRLEIYTPKGFKEKLEDRAKRMNKSISEYIRIVSDNYDNCHCRDCSKFIYWDVNRSSHCYECSKNHE